MTFRGGTRSPGTDSRRLISHRCPALTKITLFRGHAPNLTSCGADIQPYPGCSHIRPRVPALRSHPDSTSWNIAIRQPSFSVDLPRYSVALSPSDNTIALNVQITEGVGSWAPQPTNRHLTQGAHGCGDMNSTDQVRGKLRAQQFKNQAQSASDRTAQLRKRAQRPPRNLPSTAD